MFLTTKSREEIIGKAQQEHPGVVYGSSADRSYNDLVDRGPQAVIDLQATIDSLLKRIEALEKTGGTETSKVVNNAFVFQKDFGIFNGKNIVLGKTVGTKIGTLGGASGQKLAFYGKTPIVQPAFQNTSGGFAQGIGTAAKSDSTWDGGSGNAYGVQDIVKMLKTIGLLTQ